MSGNPRVDQVILSRLRASITRMPGGSVLPGGGHSASQPDLPLGSTGRVRELERRIESLDREPEFVRGVWKALVAYGEYRCAETTSTETGTARDKARAVITKARALRHSIALAGDRAPPRRLIEALEQLEHTYSEQLAYFETLPHDNNRSVEWLAEELLTLFRRHNVHTRRLSRFVKAATGRIGPPGREPSTPIIEEAVCRAKARMGWNRIRFLRPAPEYAG